MGVEEKRLTQGNLGTGELGVRALGGMHIAPTTLVWEPKDSDQTKLDLAFSVLKGG